MKCPLWNTDSQFFRPPQSRSSSLSQGSNIFILFWIAEFGNILALKASLNQIFYITLTHLLLIQSILKKDI